MSFKEVGSAAWRIGVVWLLCALAIAFWVVVIGRLFDMSPLETRAAAILLAVAALPLAVRLTRVVWDPASEA